MNYKVLVLDMDNTLIDFDIMEDKSLRTAFAHFDIELTDEILEDYYKINKKMWRDLENGIIEQEVLLVKRFDLLFKKYEIAASPDDFNKKYLNSMPDNVVFLEGAEDFLKYAKDRYIVIMMTNGFKDVQKKKIERLDMAKYFHHIIISGEVGFEKPMRGIYEHLFSLLESDIKKEDVLVLGDSISADIKGGNDYGLDTVWFNKRKKDMDSPADYEVKSIADLMKILTCT